MHSVGNEEGKRVDMGGFGTRYLITGEESGGRFALVEHVLASHLLAAPVHTHEREDEYSFVLAGRVGFQIDDEVRVAGPGETVFKPRARPHAFWNAGDEEARLLELISPAGFERYFEELAPLLPPRRSEPDFPAMAEVQARYGLTMDVDSIGPLVERHGLAAPG